MVFRITRGIVTNVRPQLERRDLHYTGGSWEYERFGVALRITGCIVRGLGPKQRVEGCPYVWEVLEF